MILLLVAVPFSLGISVDSAFSMCLFITSHEWRGILFKKYQITIPPEALGALTAINKYQVRTGTMINLSDYRSTRKIFGDLSGLCLCQIVRKQYFEVNSELIKILPGLLHIS